MIFNIFIILLYLLVNINSVEATDINENNIMAEDKIMMYDAETGETTEVIFDKKKLNKLNMARTFDGGIIIIELGNKNRKDRFFMANNTLSATDSPVTNTNEFPYKAICQLQYGEGGQAKGSGTGALVGYRILLTAAHGGYYPYKTTGTITNAGEAIFKGSNYSESWKHIMNMNKCK